MKSTWSEEAAAAMVAHYAGKGHGSDLALRVYSSRLLGRDPHLVLHGGGNTSVKTTLPDLFQDPVEVLCVKGSGWDMADIEPAGLPAVRRQPLLRLRTLAALSDEEMVNQQRSNLLDSAAPNPSVETLLHAFLPHKFIDHTHATAVLSLIDQPDGDRLAEEVYGPRMGLVPYIMPGFALAKKAAEIYEADPRVEGLILLKHGIFTFGSTAREAYERMIAMVDLAEQRLAKGRKTLVTSASLPEKPASVAQLAPILRGLLTQQDEAGRRWILDFRSNDKIRAYVDAAELARFSQQGVVTPDHTIRTKNWPVILPPAALDDADRWRQAAGQAIAAFCRRYDDYVVRHNQSGAKQRLDPLPRVALVPNLGLFGIGASAKDAAIAADIAENSVACILDAEAIGRYQPVSDAEMFDLEYWSLEQAKLGKGKEKPFSRKVVLITGGGGAIGAATARAFAAEGAEIALLDQDGEAAAAVARQCGKSALAIAADVTSDAEVSDAFDRVAARFGGIDVVLSNAGAAWQGEIGSVSDAVLHQSFDLNFFAHQRVAQNAVRVFKAQGVGGCLLFNISKQAVNPGRGFGPYGLPKAATLALMKQYALDYGRDLIRSNGVNADRIRSGLLSDAMIAARAEARGVSAADYMGGNLLGREVTAEHVAQAFLFLAGAERTTAALVTVDGGNIEASLR